MFSEEELLELLGEQVREDDGSYCPGFYVVGVEVFTDCEAKKLSHALLYDCDKEAYISKDELMTKFRTKYGTPK